MTAVDTAAALTGEQYDLLVHVGEWEVTRTGDRWVIDVTDTAEQLRADGLVEPAGDDSEGVYLWRTPAGKRAVAGFGQTQTSLLRLMVRENPVTAVGSLLALLAFLAVGLYVLSTVVPYAGC